MGQFSNSSLYKAKPFNPALYVHMKLPNFDANANFHNYNTILAEHRKHPKLQFQQKKLPTCDALQETHGRNSEPEYFSVLKHNKIISFIC